MDVSSWGLRRNIKIDEVRTAPNLIKQIVTTVSCGGNALVNVGPAMDGMIRPVFQGTVK